MRTKSLCSQSFFTRDIRGYFADRIELLFFESEEKYVQFPQEMLS